MVLIKDAFVRTTQDFSQATRRLLINPFQIQGKHPFLKLTLGCLVISFLLIGVSIFPYLTQKISGGGQDHVYLNIMEPAARGKSSLCTFKAKSDGNLILNTTFSKDNQILFISFPMKHMHKVKCSPYESNLPFHKDTPGTIINVFSAQGHQFFSNNTSNEMRGIVIRSQSPLQVFIRNKEAVLVHYPDATASLLRKVIGFDHKVEKVASRGMSFVDFEGELTFTSKSSSKALDTLKRPKVFLYLTPKLEEVDFTALSSYQQTPNLKLNFGFKDHGEQVAFVKLSGELDVQSHQLGQLNGLTISKYEFIDPVKAKPQGISFKIAYYVFLAFGMLFIVLFTINLSDLAVHRNKKVVNPENKIEVDGSRKCARKKSL